MKTISAHSKSTVLIVRTFQKNIHLVTLSFKQEKNENKGVKMENSTITKTGIEYKQSLKNGKKEKEKKLYCLKNEIRKRKAAWIAEYL